MKRTLAIALASLCALLAVAYVCDYLVLRHRVAKNSGAFGTVTLRPYYAVAMNSGKTEFMFADPVDRECVHSMFPHMGDAPCWYLSRRTEQRIDLNAGGKSAKPY